ncbi:MAG: alpha/beta fold hydrolase [Acidilobaceae archaeon]
MSYTRIIRVLEDLVNVPEWSVVGVVSDGKVLAISDEGGFRSLWILDPQSGEKLKLTREPIMWVAEPPLGSRRAVYTKDVSGGRELQLLYSVDVKSGVEEALGPMDPLRIFGVADDGVRVAFTGVTMEDVAVYVARKGSVEKVQRLPGFAFVSDIEGDLIAGFGSLKGSPFSMEVFIYDLSTGEFKVYTPKDGSVNWNPKIVGRSVVFESSAFALKRRELLEYNVDTGELKRLTFKFPDYQAQAPVEHVSFEFYDGSWLVVGKSEGRSRVYVDGKLIRTPEGMIAGASLYKGKVYLSHSTLSKPPSILEVDVESGVSRVLLEPKLPDYIAESFGKIGFTYVSSKDGLQIPTFYVESRLAGRPGPTVVYVHGGPWAEVADWWDITIASLVASGFNVVAPNFRGSTGYGEPFRQMDIGDPGGGDLEDVAAVSTWSWEAGLADRLFIMGYSYGGYMTLWAMANKPDLYECGVAGASVADWEEMYKLSDAIFRAFIEVLFDKNMDLLKERSPINKVENIKKPLCIVHPQNDTRTPLKPVLRLMDKMVDLGKTFEAHIAPDMGHVVNTVEDAVKILFPALIFLNRCLSKPYAGRGG